MSEIATAFDVSSNIKGKLCSGLAIVAGLEDHEQHKLLKWARTPRATGLYGDVRSLVSEAGINEEYADQVRMAVVMMVSSIAGSPVTSQDFIDAGVESGTLTNKVVRGIKRFADLIVANRIELNKENDMVKLQNSVLPTLFEFEVTLDARVQVSEGDIAYAVPVVVGYVDTDSEDQVVWFQMNEERVREIRDKLNVTLDHLEVMKKWLETSINSGR